MRNIQITVVYTNKDEEVQYLTTEKTGYEDVSYRKVIENGEVSGPMRIREWELRENGVFHSSIPKWIIYGPREWETVFALDSSPPPKELQERKERLYEDS